MNDEVTKSNEDLIVGKTNFDHTGKMIYDPMIATLARWYGLAGASILAVLAYLIASGTMPVRDLGQFSASDNGVATFVGTVIGAAIGGLAGALTGLAHVVRRNRDHGE